MSAIGINYLSPRQRDRLKMQIEQEKRRLSGVLVVPRSGKDGNTQRAEARYSRFMDPALREDPGMIQGRIRKLERALSQGVPPPATGREREKLEKQMRADREYLQRSMASKKLHRMKADDPEFGRACAAVKIENSQEYAERAVRYKNAVKRLDPDNQDVSNIENLRPE